MHHPNYKQCCLLHHKEGKKEKPQKNTKQKRKINERGKRTDTEVYQVDTDDRTGDRIHPGFHRIDRQTINLPRMVGAKWRQSISLLWQQNTIYPGGHFRPKDTPLTGEEKIFSQCQEILHHKTSSFFT